MKKYLSLLLCIIMLMSSFLLASCDSGDEDTGAVNNEGTNKPETTEPETKEPETTEKKPEAPVEVDKLCGKTPLELYRAADESVGRSGTFESSATMTKTENGEKSVTTGVSKLANNNFYIKKVEDGKTSEITLIGTTMYMSALGKKIKTTGVDTNELWEEIGASSIKLEDSKFNGVKLYCLDGVYYFSVQLTADEAEQLDMNSDTATATFYFDKDATITKVRASQENCEYTEVYTNVGKPLTVSAPQDASTYVQTVSDEEWSKYTNMCAKLMEMTSYYVDMELKIDGASEQVMTYYADSYGNECIDVLYGASSVCIYQYGGLYYASQGDSEPQVFTPDADTLSMFQSMSEIKNGSAAKIAPKYGISDMAVTNQSEKTVITLSDLSGDTNFKYTYSSDYSEISVEMSTVEDGVRQDMIMAFGVIGAGLEVSPSF